MSLELTSDEARALDLGLRWGLISRDQIIKIADVIIAKATSVPSSQICELSVCARNFQVREVLLQFQMSPEKWPPVVILLTKYLNLTNMSGGELHSLYYYLSNYSDWGDPEPWRVLKIRTHELSDARLGIWGDADEISKEIYEILLDIISGYEASKLL